MRIQHNIAALNSHRQLTSNNSAVAKNLEKLSSGYRINRAGDDAAGLAVSEKMRAQITGLNTASKNAQDGISLVQTAEGALTEVHSMLNRMTELAGQAANGTFQDDVDRENAMEELNSLRDEIDRISEGTNFNGIKLLDGSMGGGTAGAKVAVLADAATKTKAFSYEVSGADVGVKVDFATVTGAAAGAGVTASWANGTLTFTMQSDAAGSNKITQADIDNAIKNAALPDSAKNIKLKLDGDIEFSAASVTGTVANASGTIAKAEYASSKGSNVTNTSGAATNLLLTSTKAGASTSVLTFSNTPANAEGATAATSGNVALNLDANKTYTAAQINQMLGKSGAKMNISFDGTLKGSDFLTAGNAAGATLTLGTNGDAGAGLASGGGLSLQIGDTAESFNQLNVEVASMSTTSLGISGLDIGTQNGAKAAVDVIKKAINTVSSTRGDLGAIQNRLEHTINNLGVTSENMTAAESRIRDVDMAQEMMTYTKNNILTQASQAMLAQANQLPQGVLQLLQ